MEETINKIEKLVQRIKVKNPKNKEKLVELLEKLKSEARQVPGEKIADIKSMANFAESAFHEAEKENREDGLQSLSIKGLEKSVKTFENSHPELVRVVNEICTLLARLGI